MKITFLSAFAIIITFVNCYSDQSSEKLDHVDLIMIFDKEVMGSDAIIENGKIILPSDWLSADEFKARLQKTTVVISVLAKAILAEKTIILSNIALKNLMFFGQERTIENALRGLDNHPTQSDLKEEFEQDERVDDNSKYGKDIYDKKIVAKLLQSYNVYKSKNSDLSLSLLVPKKYSLLQIGIDKSVLDLIPEAAVKSTYLDLYNTPETAKTIKNPIQIELLAQWFDTSKEQPFKRIYLTGHGYPPGQSLKQGEPPRKGRIAELELDEYQNLLKLLNDNTQFLYINSCFSGGSNLADMHMFQVAFQSKTLEQLKQQSKVLQDVSEIRYIIVIGSISDIEVSGTLGFGTTPELGVTPTDFQKFFAALDNYFKGTEEIQRALSYVSGNALVNLPSIRYPGPQSFFRVAVADKDILSITFMAQQIKKHEPEKKFVLDGKKLVLLYTSLIDIPLQMRGEPMSIMSMIPGAAIHVFDSFDAPSTTLEEVLAMLGGFQVHASKAFIIKKLNCILPKSFTTTLLPADTKLPFKQCMLIAKHYYHTIEGNPIKGLNAIVLCVDQRNRLIPFSIEKKTDEVGKEYELKLTQLGDLGAGVSTVKYMLDAIKKQVSWQVGSPINNELIQSKDPREIKKLVELRDTLKNMLADAKPAAYAITEATGGYQTLEMLDTEINTIIDNLPKLLPVGQ